MSGYFPDSFGSDLTIDMSQVDIFRPSGLAYVFVLAFTAQRHGAAVHFTQPPPGVRRDYLQLTNFFNVLSSQGLRISEGQQPLNEGNSPGLIKPSTIMTTATTSKNVEASGILFDRFRKALKYMQIGGHERAASVFSELSMNAAEHSHSPNEAFVMAQAYPQTQSIEIAVADVGRGIRAALGNDAYLSDADAIAAALQEEVTGRRDASGNLTEGGYGLPTVAEEADVLEIRSGTARLKSENARNARGELVLFPRQVPRLDGTLVAATISSREHN